MFEKCSHFLRTHNIIAAILVRNKIGEWCQDCALIPGLTTASVASEFLTDHWTGEIGIHGGILLLLEVVMVHTRLWNTVEVIGDPCE